MDKRGGPASIYWMTTLCLKTVEELNMANSSESCSSDQQQGTAACRKGVRRQAVYDRLEKGEAIKVTTNFLQHLDTHLLNALVTNVEIPGRYRELELQWGRDI